MKNLEVAVAAIVGRWWRSMTPFLSNHTGAKMVRVSLFGFIGHNSATIHRYILCLINLTVCLTALCIPFCRQKPITSDLAKAPAVTPSFAEKLFHCHPELPP